MDFAISNHTANIVADTLITQVFLYELNAKIFTDMVRELVSIIQFFVPY
jgi:hypothetical protein